MLASSLYLMVEMAMIAILVKIAKEIENTVNKPGPLATVSWNG